MIPRVAKLMTYPTYDGHRRRSERTSLCSSPACGTLISRTSSVIAIAKTPSLNVSRRSVSERSGAPSIGRVTARSGGSDQLRFAEEERDLFRGVLGGVAPVDRVSLDVRPVEVPQCSRLRFLRIGRAHGLAQMGDRVLPLEGCDDDRPFGHESDEAVEEGPFFVHGVESARLLGREAQSLQPADAESLFFESCEKSAGPRRGDGIRLEDRQGP